MTALKELLSDSWNPGADALSLVRASDDPRIAALTLNRPTSLNSISGEMWRAIPELLGGLGEPVSALVLRGAGSAALSVGADITEFRDLRMTPKGALEYSAAIGAAIDALRAKPYPVVAMIGGLAVGGGCELAAACDIRIVSERAKFGVPIGGLGVTLGFSEAAALAELIGVSQTYYLVVSGRLIGSDEALRMGLVSEVVPESQLSARIEQFVTDLAALSKPTIRSLKRTLRAVSRGANRGDAEAFAAELFDVYAGEDLREGVAAFERKVPPIFGKEGL